MTKPQKSLAVLFLIIIVALVLGVGAYMIYKKNSNVDKASGITNNLAVTGELISALVKPLDPNHISQEDSNTYQSNRDKLAQLADSETVQAIVKAYYENNKSPETGLARSYLLGALARVKSPSAVAGLGEIVNNELDPGLHTAAVTALSLMGTTDAVHVFVSAIQKSYSAGSTNRLEYSLSEVKNRDSLNYLIELLNTNTNEEIRRQVALAIGNIPGDVSVAALKNSQKIELSKIVKSAIEISLKKLITSNKLN